MIWKSYEALLKHSRANGLILIPAVTISPFGNFTWITVSAGLFLISSTQWTKVSSKSKMIVLLM
jgi:hypothetical protein